MDNLSVSSNSSQTEKQTDPIIEGGASEKRILPDFNAGKARVSSDQYPFSSNQRSGQWEVVLRLTPEVVRLNLHLVQDHSIDKLFKTKIEQHYQIQTHFTTFVRQDIRFRTGWGLELSTTFVPKPESLQRLRKNVTRALQSLCQSHFHNTESKHDWSQFIHVRSPSGQSIIKVLQNHCMDHQCCAYHIQILDKKEQPTIIENSQMTQFWDKTLVPKCRYIYVYSEPVNPTVINAVVVLFEPQTAKTLKDFCKRKIPEKDKVSVTVTNLDMRHVTLVEQNRVEEGKSLGIPLAAITNAPTCRSSKVRSIVDIFNVNGVKEAVEAQSRYLLWYKLPNSQKTNTACNAAASAVVGAEAPRTPRFPITPCPAPNMAWDTPDAGASERRSQTSCQPTLLQFNDCESEELVEESAGLYSSTAPPPLQLKIVAGSVPLSLVPLQIESDFASPSSQPCSFQAATVVSEGQLTFTEKTQTVGSAYQGRTTDPTSSEQPHKRFRLGSETQRSQESDERRPFAGIRGLSEEAAQTVLRMANFKSVRPRFNENLKRSSELEKEEQQKKREEKRMEREEKESNERGKGQNMEGEISDKGNSSSSDSDNNEYESSMSSAESGTCCHHDGCSTTNTSEAKETVDGHDPEADCASSLPQASAKVPRKPAFSGEYNFDFNTLLQELLDRLDTETLMPMPDCNGAALLHRIRQIAVQLKETADSHSALEEWYNKILQIRRENFRTVDLEGLNPRVVVEKIEKALEDCRKHRYRVLPVVVYAPPTRAHPKNSKDCSPKTLFLRKQALMSVWRLLEESLYLCHAPAVKSKCDQVMADCLLAQMDPTLKTEIAKALTTQKCMIRRYQGEERAKKIQWKKENDSEATERIQENLNEFLCEMKDTSMSNDAMRKMRKFVKKVIRARFPSEQACQLANAAMKAKAIEEFDLTATLDGYQVPLRTEVEREIMRFLETIKGSKDEAGGRVKGLNCLFDDKLQTEWLVKLTLDARRVTRHICHTEVMMMILPTKDIQSCIDRCQSPKAYRTIVLWEGNDHRDAVRGNLEDVLKDVEDLEKYGVLLDVSDADHPQMVGVLDRPAQAPVNTSSSSASSAAQEGAQTFKSSQASQTELSDHKNVIHVDVLPQLDIKERVWQANDKKPSQGEEYDLRNLTEEEYEQRKLRKMQVKIIFVADMAAVAGVLGFGCAGNHYCTVCNTEKCERNIPYILVRIEKDASVAEVANKFDIGVETFRALNSKLYRKGKFQRFQKDFLEKQTQPFVITVENSAAKKRGTTERGVQGHGVHDQDEFQNRYSGQIIPDSKKQSKPRACSKKTNVHSECTTRESDLENEGVLSENHTLKEGTLVRVPKVHEHVRKSDWLKERWTNYENSIFLCTLHANMRITESLFNYLADVAQKWNLVEDFNLGIQSVLGLRKALKKPQGSSSYERISLLGWEARSLLEKTNGILKIEKFLDRVWLKDVTEMASGEGATSTRKQKSTEKQSIRSQFVEDAKEIWKLWASVVELLLERDPRKIDADRFARECREFICMYQNQFHGDYIKSFYLHWLQCHAGESMRRALRLGVTLGMIANDGAERRHQYGKRAAKRSFWGGRWRLKYPGIEKLSNISSYICMLEILVGEGVEDLESTSRATDAGMTQELDEDLIQEIEFDFNESDEQARELIEGNIHAFRLDQRSEKFFYIPENDRLIRGGDHNRYTLAGYGSEDVSDDETILDPKVFLKRKIDRSKEKEHSDYMSVDDSDYEPSSSDSDM